jgi:hypothetical protein
MTKDAAQKKRTSQQEDEQQKKEPSHPLDPAILEQSEVDLTDLEWDTSLLLLIPHRLGRDYFEEKYVKSVAHIFSLPQSVGILGGRPRGARWFYGAYADGSKVLGKRDNLRYFGNIFFAVWLSRRLRRFAFHSLSLLTN